MWPNAFDLETYFEQWLDENPHKKGDEDDWDEFLSIMGEMEDYEADLRYRIKAGK